MHTTNRIFLWIFVTCWSIQISQAADIKVNSMQTLNPFADDGQCTLPEAVEASNNNSASGNSPGECVAGEAHPVIDTIQFSVEILPAVFAVETALQLTESIHIEGQHKDLVTITGIGMDRVIEITGSSGHQFILSDFSVVGGYAPLGVPPVSVGGGMMITLFGATVDITRLRFENNNAEYAGGALAIGYGGTLNNETSISQTEFFNNSSIGSSTQANGNHGGGGAIFIGGYQTVTIKQSTFSENQALSTTAPLPTGDGMGGALWMLSSNSLATSTLEIDSCTFDNNSANGVGGAVSIGGPGFPADQSLVNIKHSTITANTADANQSDTGNAGGGIYSSTSTAVNIFNNVIARNIDLSTNKRTNLTGQFNTFGHNFINGNLGISATFPMGSPNANNDFVTPALATPDLAPLADNGGPTLTRATDTGSPLIDQGKCGNASTDQRDFKNELEPSRIHDDKNVPDFVDGCDIGAFESGTVSQDPTPETQVNLYAVLEDQSLVAFDLDGSLTPADINDNGLLWNDSDDDPLWITNAGTVSLSSADMNDPGVVELLADGTFSYTPPMDEFGDATGSYYVSDRLNGEEVEFGIQVFAVNDAPEFEVDGAQIFGFTELTQFINYEGWAINIHPGADNESAQVLTFDLLYLQGDDSFFDVVPSIDSSTGTLTFDVSDAAEGTVEMMVFLTDNGGTQFGGEDTSTGVPITITRTVGDVIFKNSFELPQSS